KVHLDGYNLLPLLKGEVKENPRKSFFYWSDDGDLMAMRYEQWKIVFSEQRAEGLEVWREPLASMRIPKLFNIRSDPFERGEESLSYEKWFVDRVFLLVPAQGMVAEYLKTFEQFPPRQRPASFSIDEALARARQRQAQLEAAASGGTGAGAAAHDGGSQPAAPEARGDAGTTKNPIPPPRRCHYPHTSEL